MRGGRWIGRRCRGREQHGDDIEVRGQGRERSKSASEKKPRQRVTFSASLMRSVGGWMWAPYRVLREVRVRRALYQGEDILPGWPAVSPDFFDKRGRRRLKRRAMLGRDGEYAELAKMQSRLPLNPTYRICGIIPEECSVFKSALSPLRCADHPRPVLHFQEPRRA